MSQYFPLGLQPYVLGGLLLGAGIGLVYWTTGRIAGISGILTAVHSWWSRREFFREPEKIVERTWKGVLVVGLILGAAAHALSTGEAYVTAIAPWRLALGGIFVGFGTRLARGCTSGHGICGISATSPSSIVSTGVFMAVAIVVAHLTAALGIAS